MSAKSNESKLFAAGFDAAALRPAPGQVVALLGGQAEDRSALLRALAGLDAEADPVPTAELGLLAARPGFFPWLNLAENLAFGLAGTTPFAREGLIANALVRAGLGGLADRRPGALSPAELQGLAIARLSLLRPKLLLVDAPFAALDDEDADDWCRRACGHAAASRFFEPMVHGLYFHPLRGASRALLEALMTFRSAQTLAVRGGWQALPRRMARGLDVRTGCHVESLVQTPHGVRARVGGDRIDADWAVLATPAPAARSLVLDPTPEEAAVLDAGYARAMHVALGMHADWPLPPELRGMHGLIFGPHRHDGAPTLVASMVVESERLAQEGPPVLCAMLGDTAALRHAASSDETVAREVAQWLDTHWPGASARVTDHRIQRWSEAEPLSPAGRARAAQHYRRQWSPARRIILCGDHLGLPWTDGAVETGLWAAHRLEVWAADTFLPG